MICRGLVTGPSDRADCSRSHAGLHVPITPVTLKFVSRKCCVLSGRGLWFGLFTSPEESWWVLFVAWVWSQNLDKKRSWPTMVCTAMKKTWGVKPYSRCVCVCVCVWSLRSCFLFGAFEKLWKTTFSFVISVCLSVHMEQLGSHRADFQEFWYWIICRKSFERIKFHENLTKITFNIHEDQYT